MPDAAEDLRRLLRALRENEFPEARLTQESLARALGAAVSLSPSAISTWESGGRIPATHRLEIYARFFATPRSVASPEPRLLEAHELTPKERTRADELYRTLIDLREAALSRSSRSLWRFDDGARVTIVCPTLPEKKQPEFANLQNPNFIRAHRLGDLDAMIELYGHIRAENPSTIVTVRASDEVITDDLSQHVVVLGGVTWNGLTRQFSEKLPVQQISRDEFPEEVFVVTETGREFVADVREEGDLEPRTGAARPVVDYGLFVRAPNPYARDHSLTICNATFTWGVLGVVRFLTADSIRAKNEQYLAQRFAAADAFLIMFKVRLYKDGVFPTALTDPGVVVYDWPRADISTSADDDSGEALLEARSG